MDIPPKPPSPTHRRIQAAQTSRPKSHQVGDDERRNWSGRVESWLESNRSVRSVPPQLPGPSGQGGVNQHGPSLEVKPFGTGPPEMKWFCTSARQRPGKKVLLFRKGGRKVAGTPHRLGRHRPFDGVQTFRCSFSNLSFFTQTSRNPTLEQVALLSPNAAFRRLQQGIQCCKPVASANMFGLQFAERRSLPDFRASIRLLTGLVEWPRRQALRCHPWPVDAECGFWVRRGGFAGSKQSTQTEEEEEEQEEEEEEKEIEVDFSSGCFSFEHI